jgi:Flp pilus assembly protein TadG
VVEFALVAPLLFIVLFGIIQFGRLLNAYNDMTQLAGQGARAAAVNTNPDGSPIGAGAADGTACESQTYSIQCQLAGYFPGKDSLSGVSACIPSVPSAIGQPVTVKMTYSFSFLGTQKLFGFPATISVTTSQTERSEANPTYTAGNQSGGACS